MDYIALGCMSGTSLDGIDLSLIRSDGDTYSEEIMNYFQPYSKDLKNKLHEVIQRGYLTDPKITTQLSKEYSRTIQQFLDSNKKYEVNVIGIHGQTLFHDEKTKISIQLFDKNLKLNTSIPVICNFRKNDLLNGGFGAPIIPIYHKLIHQKINRKSTVFVNIGGVTNITIINQEGIFAGDTSFGNALVNDLIKKKFNFEMDEDGYISGKGIVNDFPNGNWDYVIVSGGYYDFVNCRDRNCLEQVNDIMVKSLINFVKKNDILVLFVEDNDSLVKIVQQLLIALVDALCMHENEAHLGDDDVHYYEVECDLNEAGSELEQAEGILTIHTLA